MRSLALVVHQIRYEQKLYWRSPSSAMFTFLFPILLKDLGTHIVLLVLVGLHVLAALVYLVWKRQNLIGAMITGRKPRRDVVAAGATAPTLRFASGWLALGLLVVAAAIVYAIVKAGG